ncbi:hypothetical protein BJY00DRAFT_314983 [Aspergillus carlsbadensis]|nr:hypothetical protein BJY00DRAFT_314983 [Aspergillus carlsbadensis]
MGAWPSIASMLAMIFTVPHASSESLTPTTMSKIDLHSHYVPDFWREESILAGYGEPDGIPGIPAWSEEAHLEFMAQANITKSILSITSPGTHLIPGNNTHARQLSRQCNEFAADLKRRRPEEFGFWAALPLPDVEGSLAELAYALDHLDADGVAVFTNAHGVHLGDEPLSPLFRELDCRNVTVFVHPTSPCIRSAHPGGQPQPASPLADSYPAPMFEYLFESARGNKPFPLRNDRRIKVIVSILLFLLCYKKHAKQFFQVKH